MFRKIFLIFIVFLVANAAFAKDGIDVKYDKKGKFYLYKIDLKELAPRIRPYIVQDGLKTAREVFKQNNFEFVVNGGFFDPNTSKSVSYVTIDKKEVGTPFESIEMIKKLSDEKRVENVINRSELRIYKHNLTDVLKFDIAHHFDSAPKDYEILHALGGGPMIYPDNCIEKEGFVKYDDTGHPVIQSAHVLKKRARTVVALKNNDLYVIIFTNFAPVTIPEVGQKLKKFNFDKIMAFDGGPSTSLNYADNEIFSSNNEQRKVKSFLIIQK